MALCISNGAVAQDQEATLVPALRADGMAEGPEFSAKVPVEAPKTEDCVVADPRPIYQGFGWSHYVYVRNNCQRAVTCSVATSVDPSPTYPLQLSPEQAQSIRTRYGSDTNQYQPIVACKWSN